MTHHVSNRSSSDNSEATENATGFLGGSVNATIDAAEYKDTVLFLAQQQQLQHQEMMELMRNVLLAVQSSQQQQQQHVGGGDGAGSGNGDGATTSDYPGFGSSRAGGKGFAAIAPTSPSTAAGAGASTSNLEYNVGRLNRVAGSPGTNPRQLADGSVGLVGSYASTQSGWFRSVNSQETELQAARSRIAQLEAHVRLLESQLASKDETIRALTEANIASMAVLSKSSGDSIFASPTALHKGDLAAVSSSSRLAKLHQDVATELNTEIVTALNTRPTAIARISSSSAADNGLTPVRDEQMSRGGPDSNTSNKMSSPALRQLLERHQQRCQQLLA